MYTKLKELRKEKNITSKKMSDILNISKAYYSQIENCNRNLSYSIAYEIASVFNLKPDEIFYDEFKKRV